MQTLNEHQKKQGGVAPKCKEYDWKKDHKTNRPGWKPQLGVWRQMVAAGNKELFEQAMKMSEEEMKERQAAIEKMNKEKPEGGLIGKTRNIDWHDAPGPST